MGEVLVTKSYDFIKPARLRDGLGRLLGVGVLLAEGDEHKVRFLSSSSTLHLFHSISLDNRKENDILNYFSAKENS